MVYFIQAGPGGPIKIGFTKNDVKQRKMELQTGNPFKLKVLFTYNLPHPTESELHYKHSKHRLEGEWFKPHRDIKREINILQAKQSMSGFKKKSLGKKTRIQEAVDLIQIAYRKQETI